MAEIWIPDVSAGEIIIYYESAVLPIGRGTRVDHIPVISKLVLRSDSRPEKADSVWM
jgi:hypothetical protein